MNQPNMSGQNFAMNVNRPVQTSTMSGMQHGQGASHPMSMSNQYSSGMAPRPTGAVGTPNTPGMNQMMPQGGQHSMQSAQSSQPSGSHMMSTGPTHYSTPSYQTNASPSTPQQYFQSVATAHPALRDQVNNIYTATNLSDELKIQQVKRLVETANANSGGTMTNPTKMPQQPQTTMHSYQTLNPTATPQVKK